MIAPRGGAESSVVAPVPAPISAVLFDFHHTLVDGGDVVGWMRAGWAAWAGNGRWASDPTRGSESDPVAGLGAERAADVANYLDHIWDHVRVINPNSARDESPQQHRAIFLETMAGCPGVEPAPCGRGARPAPDGAFARDHPVAPHSSSSIRPFSSLPAEAYSLAYFFVISRLAPIDNSPIRPAHHGRTVREQNPVEARDPFREHFR